MGVLFLLIGLSLVFALGFLAAFIYSVVAGQYDDDYTPSVRILFDNSPKSSSHKNNETCK
jgi:cbb3-type cytochrome oxidase maturation protein